MADIRPPKPGDLEAGIVITRQHDWVGHYEIPIIPTPPSGGGRRQTQHVCYFCSPRHFPDMPEGFTLCACCGVLMWVGKATGPLNNRMMVCQPCDHELREGMK